MPRKLKNVDVSFVSIVDKAANKKKFFLTKSEQEPTFEKEVKIIKGEDEEQKLVYGIVYSPGSADDPNTHDAHGDFMTAEEIEKSAHNFIAKYRNIDAQHDFNAGAGEVVESYVAPVDMEINGETITKGTWVLVTKATDAIWKDIKDGKMTGYSLAGVAETEVIEEEVTKTEEKQFKSFFQLMKGFFSGEKVEKGEVRDKFNQNKHRRDVNASFSALEDTFYQSLWNAPTADAIDLDRIEAAALEFVEIINELKGTEAVVKAWEDKPVISLAVEVEKAGKKISAPNMADIDAAIESLTNLKTRVTPSPEGAGSEDDSMNQEQLEALSAAVEKAVGPIKEELASVKKHLNLDEEKTEEDIKVEKAVEAATAPLREEIEALKKSQGISNQQDTDVVEKTEVKKSVWNGLL
ncbi:XkdF-like putative serine protease domain-containing protein [Bacillus paranthracis]|uniref:XkdF-like putative serine protease domain-containing protein n=1 Tax=Bacillus cereus group TaxID=86661 RepID=UPI002111970E|nr:XkdF-like putative serine protease domain-containing protein [Bacillus paranthracis]MCQ6524839.1 XkdF-like putative serine protease domain-containing protein [Bacillus paranthracis]MCW4577148.1 XkdF-like putative serine protease domain-containing protein [Bacillus pacificus]MED1612565.1 XkdF-like putative serine protease domain-containing protein [Bacillus paranthracis]MED1683480.1 XkdF-like putative serine protease domain-containing protein [Bacillus paranthracis]